MEGRLADFRRAELVLLRAGLTLAEIRAAPEATLASWLRILRDALPGGRRGAPERVKKVSKRFLEQQARIAAGVK